MTETYKRRREILETLCYRRQETMANLAFEFGVSIRTIINDIDHLSLSYPLETLRGNGGGVRVMEGFYRERGPKDLDSVCKYLKPKQQELLKRLSGNLTGNDLAVMNSIFNDFALNELF